MDRVERAGAPNQAGLPVAALDIRVSDDLYEEVAEVTEPSDDDETERDVLHFDAVLPLDIPALEIRAGLYEASADRAITPFRRRAVATRGSPVA